MEHQSSEIEDSQRVKLRYCERMPSDFPVIFSSDCFVGEGRVVNVSVPGCEIVGKSPIITGSYLEMKVLVPGNESSLSVGLAKVRWSDGQRFGVEFIRMPGHDQVRLGRLLKQHRIQPSPARLRPI